MCSAFLYVLIPGVRFASLPNRNLRQGTQTTLRAPEIIAQQGLQRVADAVEQGFKWRIRCHRHRQRGLPGDVEQPDEPPQAVAIPRSEARDSGQCHEGNAAAECLIIGMAIVAATQHFKVEAKIAAGQPV